MKIKNSCILGLTVAIVVGLAGCCSGEKSCEGEADLKAPEGMAEFTTVSLTADLSGLSENQRKIIPLLIDAGKAMDAAFWIQAYGDKEELFSSVEDPALKRYVKINYGPWSRLNDNSPFIEGVGPKSAGANYYPADITKEEFDAAAAGNKELASLYTMVRRDAEGGLIAVPYNEFFDEYLQTASDKLRAAADLAEDPGFKNYLELRSAALLSNDYFESDLAWMDMKDNMIDVVIGPIETYEDQLYGYKASFETFILIKDMGWSERLSKYAAMLPELQAGLPVTEEYKQDVPGTDSDLNAYDVIYYAGDCNAGSKTIAINLPNDEQVQARKGSRRLQLKNAMQAKFDKILVPIANELVAEEQRQHVKFHAFFSNTMFHEVAHGLGIANTLDGEGTVREALKDQASALEEGKADVLGLYMVTKLHEKGELGEEALEDYYTTFMASIFRSIRFGAASAHGRANMVRFNYFLEQGAFSRDEATGAYSADYGKMRQAVDALSELILTLQGNGDYDGVTALMAEKGKIGEQLQTDLDRLNAAGIPVDIIFDQGLEVLGL
jgi:hypothetical protein